MHWLSWHDSWQFLKSWQGIAVAVFGVAGVIYYGPKQALETWDWYLNRFFDEPLLDLMREQSLLTKELSQRSIEGYSVGELAKLLKRSQRSIGKSIKRLKRKDRLELYHGGFRPKQ